MSTTQEESGTFSFFESGEKTYGMKTITTRHHLFSVIFRIKMNVEDKVIAEGLELGKTLISDKRLIDGKLLKIELVSFDRNSFTINLINESDYGITGIWVGKYSILNDIIGLFKK